jgi:hypothetical protein
MILLSGLASLPAVAPSTLWAAQGTDSRPGEYQVKAAYLYNFARFVRWPPSESSVFLVCVLGRDPFGPILDNAFANEQLEGKPVSIRRIDRAQETADCRVLFISSSEERTVRQILAVVADRNMLTVSDMPDFCLRGGMIQLFLDGHRVRFEANLSAAMRAGLSLSSDLLRVATRVH